jgi:membrane-bound metal-dependent hydrolase YbcI (DUF457 family)
MQRMGENESYAVGHFSLGYILGKASARVTKTELDIPVVFMLSVFPDIDIVINMIVPQIEHRGPTHSIVILFAVFVPIFVVYRKRAVPYFLALIQHPLLADYVCGGQMQLFWPFTTQYYGIEVDIKSLINILLEWTLFLVFLVILVKSKDVVMFFKPHKSNLILAVPMFTVLLPILLSFPLDVPIWLMLPHVFFIFVFLVSIVVYVYDVFVRFWCE